MSDTIDFTHFHWIVRWIDLKMKRITLIAALAVSAVASQAQQIVYQNMTNMATASYRMASGAGSSLEFGDQLALAGTFRTITQVRSILQVQGTGLGTYDFDLTLRFRALDGAGGAPSTIIGTPTVYQFRGLAEGAGATAAAYTLTLGGLNVTVPNNVAVTFGLTRVGGNTGGVGFQFNAANPPAIGASDPTFFWRENTAGGTFGAFNFGGTNANVAMELTAVPEPASMAALGIGAVALLRRRRAKKA